MLDGFTIDPASESRPRKFCMIAGEIKPRLIVMCTHTAAEREKVLGSTAMNVVRNAACPVVLVPPERGSTPWHLQHVLVPHDGTPTTSAALPPAAELAEHAGAELLVAHVAEAKPAPGEPGSLTTPRYVDQPQHEWPAWIERIYQTACLHLPTRPLARADVPGPWRSRGGNPALGERAINRSHRARLERSMGSAACGGLQAGHR